MERKKVMKYPAVLDWTKNECKSIINRGIYIYIYTHTYTIAMFLRGRKQWTHQVVRGYWFLNAILYFEESRLIPGLVPGKVQSELGASHGELLRA